MCGIQGVGYTGWSAGRPDAVVVVVVPTVRECNSRTTRIRAGIAHADRLRCLHSLPHMLIVDETPVGKAGIGHVCPEPRWGFRTTPQVTVRFSSLSGFSNAPLHSRERAVAVARCYTSRRHLAVA